MYIALNAAFRQLGLKPYDYLDRVALGHIPQWIEALQWKYHGKGSAWGRKQFDTLINGFEVCSLLTRFTYQVSLFTNILSPRQAVLDTPCCLFVDELTAAYPDAKVILTTRDADKWYKSMMATVFRAFEWPSWRVLQYTDRLAGQVVGLDRALWDCFCDGDKGEKAKQAFINHNNYVRKVVPPERLLEFHPADGWGPLCRFLSVPEPGTPFPMANDTEQWQAVVEAFWMGCVKRSIMKVGIAVIVLGLFMAAGCWVRN